MNSVSYLTILGIGGYMIAGIFVVIGLFGANSKARRQENNELTDTLIKNLQLTIDEQKKELEKIRESLKEQTELRDGEIKDLTASLNHLQGRNSLLEEILKGRDPSQAAFFKEAPALFEIAHKNQELIQNTNDSISHLIVTMDNFINTITPLLSKPVV